jgi:hypothetical protein
MHNVNYVVTAEALQHKLVYHQTAFSRGTLEIA